MYLEFEHTYIYLTAAFLMTVTAMIVYNRIIYYRERKTIRQMRRLNSQLLLIMDANKTHAWTYNAKKNKFKVISKKDLTETVLTPYEFSQKFDREDFKLMKDAINAMVGRQELSDAMTVKSAPDSDGAVTEYETTLSVLRRDKHDMPEEILGTQRDVTEERRRAKENKNLMLRYHNVFNSSLVDMIYYDANGYLADLNETACKTFGVKDPKTLLKRKMKMTDIPSYREMDVRTLEHTQLSSITDIAKEKSKDERVPEVTVTSKMYYEVMLGPIRSQNTLLGVIAAGRDITEMVESTHRQKETARLIEQRTRDIQQYIRDINYSLLISESRLVNYYPDTHEMEILSNLSKAGRRIAQLHAVSLIHKTDRQKAKDLIKRMDKRRLGTISVTLCTNLRDYQRRNMYLNFRMMPITDQDGRVTHYFGLLRNDTEMAYTEKQLQEETAKAQEEEQLKNTFLQNMSYELRVPLHAVIGFAGLFKAEHSQEDEPVFAAEIKKNTDVLLNLINDILFISRLDAHMIEYNYEVFDFASKFSTWCEAGWNRLKQPVKRIVENTYNSLLVKVDPHHLGIAVEKLCAYSALTTTEGHVKARYEYLHGELLIIVEDTGTGMDVNEAAQIFDRFVSEKKRKRIGTGLDLPIVKEMIEQMGGAIDVMSEPKKGSTYLMSIPCELVSFVKKS